MKMKQTAYSILELAIVTKGHTIKEVFENATILAQKAEKYGYKRFWFAEHHNMASVSSSAPSILIGHIAQATTKIRVGSGGIMLPNHSPLIVSEQFGTLGNLYPNRIDLGLGRAPGTDQETAHAIKSDFFKAAQSFPEEINKIEAYFSNENKNEKVRATVAEGVNVPLYILGSSTDSAHLAAKKGLPYAFASHFATAQLFNALDIYRNEFKPSKNIEKPYIIAGVNIFIADTEKEAQKMATSFIKMIVGLLTGKRKDYLEEPSEMSAELEEISQHPSVQQMIKYSFIGNKEKVKKQIKDFIGQTNIDELIAVTNVYESNDRLKSYKLFAEIMKELNENNKENYL
ncbi:LLM class flavin-dependent oxidoreductase [Flavobacterium jejuense]|uniref:LLM class flavin-dependent oxidoreductase n=1 Tax=Flavobacterium jejuense TaxID=1544455 RepID=A0ABX0IKY2_9FLAO|nr:LLM class flavin-dependent oxidoreductase [Flavobacterium jejuense]NHN24246.1 LLM class flavin-dependent oxidoreductase [Flavobacterium jejuense]